MTTPEISIITPCLNQEQYIRDAIESVLRQEFLSFEHIIVDGRSTDDTLHILKQYSHLSIVSEPDRGMYDALNKGLQLAHGRIIGWLNADDLYASGAFRLVVESFNCHPEALAVSGGADTFTGKLEDNQIIKKNPPVGDVNFWQRMVDTPVTNAWFFRPEIFTQVDGFNPAYRFIADREWFIRAALAGMHPIPIDRVLYHYRQHSGSATISAEDSRSEKRGHQRIAVLTEDLQMLENFLERRDLPNEARRAIRRSHSKRAYRMAATALYHRKYQLASDAVRRGIRRDALWPVIALHMAARRLSKEFSQDP
jgi:glycosyltransferase involved in cell wall biosynthesis